MAGVVYFVQEGKSGPIKIGWTSNCPHRRRDNLQIGNSEDLYLLGVLPDADQSLEARWHKCYSKYRKRSEWFWPARELVEAIDRQFPPPERQKQPKLVYTNEGPKRLDALKSWLKSNGVRQGTIAQWLGVSQAHVSKLMRGLSPMKAHHALIIEAKTAGAVAAADLVGVAKGYDLEPHFDHPSEAA